MTLTEVINPTHRKEFLDLADTIYASDTNYVRPLDKIIEDVFDPSVNILFKNGEATRFLLYNQQNKPIGRIAVFINANKAYGYEQPTGGIGFFECINNHEAATLLFNAAKEWLQTRGMKAMDGPINFGENDNFWGLLTDGFTQPGFGMPYNPPYYHELFEACGFKTYFEQITHHLDLKRPFPERFWRIAERVNAKPELTFRHFTWKDHHQFIDDFIEVYNDAWRFHENFIPMQAPYLLNTLTKAKSFLMEEIIWYAYFNGEPVAFLVLFPDANQIIKHLHGKLNLFNKMRFKWHLLTQPFTRARVTVLGVKQHYQRMGIESALFYQLREVLKNHPNYTELELSWVGDFNPKMRTLMEAMNADFGKRHITMRCLFDAEQQNMHRSHIIPMGTKEM